MSLETLRALEHTIAKEIPSFKVKFKDESAFMCALGLLMHPFNPSFLKDFTTTFGSTVYFPSRPNYESQPDQNMVTLAHEFVHMYDSREAGARFQLSYAWPQILAVPCFVLHGVFGSPLPFAVFLGGYVAVVLATRGSNNAKAGLQFWILLGLVAAFALVISILVAKWWTFALLGGLASLGPWPSHWRTHWEVRGYSMNLAFYMWVRNALVPEEIVRHYVTNFTGPDYWFMCRDAEKVESLFALSLRKTLERQLQREEPYSTIYDFLVEQGRASKAFSD